MHLSFDAAFFSPYSLERYCPLLFASQYSQLAYILYHFQKQPHCRIQQADVQADNISLSLSAQGTLSKQWIEEIFSKRELKGRLSLKEISLVSWKAWAKQSGCLFFEPIMGRTLFEERLFPCDELERTLYSLRSGEPFKKQIIEKKREVLPKNTLLSCLEILIEQSSFLIPISESFAFALNRQMDLLGGKTLSVTSSGNQLQLDSLSSASQNFSGSCFPSKKQAAQKSRALCSEYRLTFSAKRNKKKFQASNLIDGGCLDGLELSFPSFKADVSSKSRKDSKDSKSLKSVNSANFFIQQYGASLLHDFQQKQSLRSSIALFLQEKLGRKDLQRMMISGAGLLECMRDFFARASDRLLGNSSGNFSGNTAGNASGNISSGFSRVSSERDLQEDPLFFEVLSLESRGLHGCLQDGHSGSHSGSHTGGVDIATLFTYEDGAEKSSAKKILESCVLPVAHQVGKILELNQIYLTTGGEEVSLAESGSSILLDVETFLSEERPLPRESWQEFCLVGEKEGTLHSFCQAYFFFEEKNDCARVAILFGNLDVFNS